MFVTSPTRHFLSSFSEAVIAAERFYIPLGTLSQADNALGTREYQDRNALWSKKYQGSEDLVSSIVTPV